MNVLIACEESQTSCKAFRERGHVAFSADIRKDACLLYGFVLEFAAERASKNKIKNISFNRKGVC